MQSDFEPVSLAPRNRACGRRMLRNGSSGAAAAIAFCIAHTADAGHPLAVEAVNCNYKALPYMVYSDLAY